ncbi:MAG: PASTA domain-containing protein [Bacteroidetes bacterium]|nr:PASTA domain-containing protein [Bacteroidota bacterium]
MKQWILFLFSKTFLRTALFSVLGLLLVVAGVLWWMHSTTQHGKTVSVPDIRLMKLSEAVEALEAVGLNYEVIDSTHYVPGVKEGAVVEVFPQAYAEVKLGRTLFLSTNPSSLPKYPLPNYKDQLVSYVISKFQDKGFFVDSLVLIPDLSHDLVLKVVDSKGVLAAEQAPYQTGSHFVLYVSAGESDRNAFLPDLTGLTCAQAQQTLMTYSLNLGATIIDGEINDTAAAFVLRQFPEFKTDAEVPVGSSVDLWLTSDSTAAYVPEALPVDSLLQ